MEEPAYWGEDDRASYIEDQIIAAHEQLDDAAADIEHASRIERSWHKLATARVNATIAQVEEIRRQTASILEQTEVIERATREQKPV
ncbi:hypothetical protein EGT50_07280 [Rhodococcus xishaensis]|uniref:Uncharacterized protein n=1 Tax=Rhodococcus xishaensis TaxID=2487364 RepID=A0A3S3B6F6_9NOCA|nr:hypothetical protein EGT50_07280 [Rhodococcus xishaensis]